MPIHDVGYRRWAGAVGSPFRRCSTIAWTGLRIAIKSVWVRRIIFACWLPIVYWGAGFLIFEKVFQQSSASQSDLWNDSSNEKTSEEIGDIPDIRFDIRDERIVIDPKTLQEAKQKVEEAKRLANKKIKETKEDLKDIQNELEENLVRKKAIEEIGKNLEAFPAIDQLVEGLQSDDMGTVRHTFWNWMLMTYFRYPQATGMIFLLGFVAPALIARDIRSRAFVLYFSRPIGRLEYIFGKLLIPSVFLAAITTLPALALYALGVFLSPDFSVLLNTWDIPLRVLLASLVVIIPTASLALMLSSLTQESRFSAFAWFAVWVMGHGAWLAILLSAAARHEINPFDAAKLPEIARLSSVSLYNSLGTAQSFVFGFETFQGAWISLVVLGALTACSLFVLYRRISKSVHV